MLMGHHGGCRELLLPFRQVAVSDVCSGFLQLGGGSYTPVGRRGSATKDSVCPRYRNLSDIFPLGGQSTHFTENPLG